MKTRSSIPAQRMIGILGGMSWESTTLYYNQINTIIKHELGGLHSARVLIYSLDFAPIAEAQHKGDWHKAEAILTDGATRLKAAGAEAIVLATNTMHKCSEAITDATGLPILHIADATARRINEAGFKRPLLLATAFTMEDNFYKDRLLNHGLTPVIPEAEARGEIHRIIYDELCQGEVNPQSKLIYQRIIEAHEGDSDCVIFGCTEITMLLGAEDTSLPVFDTTALHARAVVDFLIGKEEGT